MSPQGVVDALINAGGDLDGATLKLQQLQGDIEAITGREEPDLREAVSHATTALEQVRRLQDTLPARVFS